MKAGIELHRVAIRHFVGKTLNLRILHESDARFIPAVEPFGINGIVGGGAKALGAANQKEANEEQSQSNHWPILKKRLAPHKA